MSTFWVAWQENDAAIAEGKAKFFGNRVVGKFVDQGRLKKGKIDCAKYTLHLYADMNDESKFGKDPDGELVTVWGAKLIDDAFNYGTDGSGILVGDIVEIVYEGWKDPQSKDANGYHGFKVGSFRPSQFKTTVTGTAHAPVQAAAPQTPPQASAGVAAAKRIGY